MKDTADTMREMKTVKVPSLQSFHETTQVLKFLFDSNDPALIPDPMAIAAKGALNWMSLNNQKVIPACRPLKVGPTRGTASLFEVKNAAGFFGNKQ